MQLIETEPPWAQSTHIPRVSSCRQERLLGGEVSGERASRVLLGTAALDLRLLRDAVERFGDAVAVAVDTRDDMVAVEGWTAAGDLSPRGLADRCATLGVARLLVTATRRDGTLGGPDLALLEDVLGAGLPVIAAGGVSSLEDVRVLRGLGCEGAVAGSALWLGRFALADAVSLQA